MVNTGKEGKTSPKVRGKRTECAQRSSGSSGGWRGEHVGSRKQQETR